MARTRREMGTWGILLGVGGAMLLAGCRTTPRKALPPPPPAVRILRVLPLPPFQESLRAGVLGPWVRIALGRVDSLEITDTVLLKRAEGWDTLPPGTVLRLRQSIPVPPKGVCGMRSDSEGSEGLWVGRVLVAARTFRSGFPFLLRSSCVDTLWIPRPRIGLWERPDTLFWSGPLELWPWNGEGRRGVATRMGIFPGKLRLEAGDTGFRVINEVPLEIYLEGVLLAEMGPQFPIEALKAQAVAARTYALRTLLHRPVFASFHLHGDVRHQAYRGAPAPERIRKAVRETRGEVLMEGDSLAVLFYHANCGGVLADGRDVFGVDRPYLRARPDLWRGVLVCEYATREVEALRWFSRRERWHAFVPRAWLSRAFGVGEIRALRVVGRGPSGRVNRLRIEGDRGVRTVEGQHAVRRFLGRSLPSTLFRVREAPEGIWLVGWGYGHGVGMCQVGAGGMAALGASYREILEHYYPGLHLERLW